MGRTLMGEASPGSGPHGISWARPSWAGPSWVSPSWAGLPWAGPSGLALMGLALMGRALMGPALMGRALMGRASPGPGPRGPGPSWALHGSANLNCWQDYIKAGLPNFYLSERYVQRTNLSDKAFILPIALKHNYAIFRASHLALMGETEL